MRDRFKAFVKRQHLFSSEQQVLLAVSGGRDSVCMARLMRDCGFSFAIAHCNFHLRAADSDRDQAFVCRLAEDYGVPFHTVDFDTRAYADAHGESIEEAARHLRYRWFADLCRLHGYPCLATAHHRDDSVETFFLNLLRGTGIAGLHGIRPSTLIDDLAVVRPMLCFTRTDIDHYVQSNRILFVEDSTNAEPDARRNQLRLQVIPLLRQLYPAFDDIMQANIDHLADTDILYHSYIDELRARLVKPLRSRVATMPCPMYTIDPETLPEPRQTVLFELLYPFGFTADTVRRLLAGNLLTGKWFHSPTHTLVVSQGRYVLAPHCEPVAPVIVESDNRFASSPCSVIVDADRVLRPLHVRLWREGERFYPLGMTHRRLVSDVLKDMKINRLERKHVWAVTDAADNIVWLVGLCLDNRYSLTHATQRVLRLTLGQPT